LAASRPPWFRRQIRVRRRPLQKGQNLLQELRRIDAPRKQARERGPSGIATLL